MFVPRSVDRLRPNKDRQTCQASPRRLNTRASRSAPSSVAHPLGRVAPSRLPRRCTELPLRRLANRAGLACGPRGAPPPSSQRSSTKAPILGRFASSRLLSSLRGAPGSFATTTPFDQPPRRSLPRRYFDEIDAPLERTAGRRVEVAVSPTRSSAPSSPEPSARIGHCKIRRS